MTQWQLFFQEDTHLNNDYQMTRRNSKKSQGFTKMQTTEKPRKAAHVKGAKWPPLAYSDSALEGKIGHHSTPE